MCAVGAIRESHSVIPVETGIHRVGDVGSGFRRNDGIGVGKKVAVAVGAIRESPLRFNFDGGILRQAQDERQIAAA